MKGTPAELDEHYLAGKEASDGWLKRLTDSVIMGRERGLVDLFSSYGTDLTFEEVNAFVLRVARQSGLRNLVQRAQEEMEKGEGGIPYPITCTGATGILPKSIDASALPAVDPSWGYQNIMVADGGNFAVGRLVYLALRFGLLSVPSPLPPMIKTLIVAADVESLDGNWSDAASRRAQASDDEAWSDTNRIYVLLPLECSLGSGSTGRVAGGAYGIGWARKRRLENYTDSVIGREEVLGAGKVARSGIVCLLMIATIFMVEKGAKLGLFGWSGVLSVVALYRADEVYASRQAMSALLAVRHGDAPFVSSRDLSESIVPTVFYPALALAAEAVGRNILGGILCAVACLFLATSHGFKLLALGMSDISVFCRMAFVCFVAAWSPLVYRVCFYSAFTAVISTGMTWFIMGNPYRAPDIGTLLGACFIFCPFIAGIVEISVVASTRGWDPEPTSRIIRIRWFLALIAALVAAWGQIYTSRGSPGDEPSPYKLSGWSHREGGSDKVSRYIVEYGTGQGVLEVRERVEEVDSREYYAIWRG